VPALAHALVEQLRHRDQQGVPDVVPEAVVDGLEPVQVEVADADPGAGAGERGAEPVLEQGAVGQQGQRVVQRLLAQPLLQLVPGGDVLDHRHRVDRRADGVADQRDGQAGPHDVPVAVPVAQLHPGVGPLAGDDVPVQGPYPGCVLGVHQVGHPEPAQLVDRVAQHGGERGVRVHDAATHVGDADADRGAGEDRAEAGLTGLQRARHLPADVHLGLPHHLLLVEDPGPHPHQVAVGQRGLHGSGGGGRVGDAGRRRQLRQVPAQDGHGDRERIRVDQVGVDQTGPDPAGRIEIGDARRHRVDEPAGGPHQELDELVPGQRNVGRAGELVGPGRDELGEVETSSQNFNR
jgi:hypothetical protein